MPLRKLACASIRISLLISIGWLASGCETTPAVSPASIPSDQLVVGMYAERIKELLGEPISIVPGTGENYVEETWTYQMKTLQEPINDQQRIDRYETVLLLIRYGQLIKVDRKVDEHRAFSR